MILKSMKADEFRVESQNSIQTIVVNPFFYGISLQEMIHLTLNILKRDILSYISIDGKNFLIQSQTESRAEILNGKYIGYHVILQAYYAETDKLNNFLVIDEEGKHHWRERRNGSDLINKVISIDFLPDARHEAIAETLQIHLIRRDR